MTPLEQFTWEHHAAREAELFEMALVVLRDDQMPRKERVLEIDRLLKRIVCHQAGIEMSVDLPDSGGLARPVGVETQA